MKVEVVEKEEYMEWAEKIMDERAIADMIWVYESKMFINEKNYTMRLIENLRKMGYYKDIETIFREERNKQR